MVTVRLVGNSQQTVGLHSDYADEVALITSPDSFAPYILLDGFIS